MRTTPVARDEDFTCRWCGKDVPRAGRTARDHCPFCLKSVHVDDRVPGDRASTCQGRLDPMDVIVQGTEIVIVYRCTRCGASKRNRAVLDVEVPDDWEALVRLSSGVLG
ncbi:MAG: RNHCP domain-containing protein [Alphaproteobacteria bacterium]|nr:RNHCP domain-containing protein [Alphaproteobacteria bacterium]